MLYIFKLLVKTEIMRYIRFIKYEQGYSCTGMNMCKLSRIPSYVISKKGLFHMFQAPMDHGRLVFPPVPASVFAVLISYLYLSIFPLASAQCMLAGMTLGYIMYDMTHYYLHHGTPVLGYYKTLKTNHLKHHFEDQDKGDGFDI